MNKSIHTLTLSFLLVFGFLFYPIAGWSQSNLRSLSAGPWHGAVRGDEQGRATSCYLIAQKTNREFWILLRYDLTGLHLILFNKKWSLKAGDSYQGRVVIDNLFDSMVAISTPKTTAIDILLGNDEPTFESFQSGRRIKIFTHAGTKKFKLEGTRKAINVLLDCADKYLSPDGSDTTTAVFKPDYTRGMKAYKNKNYAGALREWLPLAKAGIAKAQYNMGYMYSKGVGVPKDNKVAVYWYRKAAKQGHANAQNDLGIKYEYGRGVAKDLAMAMRWYQKAAAQGDVKAQERLAALLASQSKNTLTIVAHNELHPGDITVLNPGEKIIVRFTTQPGLHYRSWIGFVEDNAVAEPTPFHTSSKDLNERTSGSFTLEVPQLVGNYRLWMYDASNKKRLTGKLVRIEVDGESAGLDVPGGVQLKPGQKFNVNFQASPNYSSYSWIGIVDLSIPKDRSMEKIDNFYGRNYLNGKSDGTLSFTAPTKPGRYLLRMQEHTFTKTLKQIELTIKAASAAPPQPVPAEAETPQPAASTGPKIYPARPAFKPGEGVEVRFSGLPARGQDWLAISGKGQGPKQYYDFVMLKNKPATGTYRFKPLPAGKYEVRLYTNWPDGGYNIAASSTVIVNSQPTPPLPAPAAPLTPQPAAPIAAMPAPPVRATETKPIAKAKTKNPQGSVGKFPKQSQESAGASGAIGRNDVTGSWAIIDGNFKTITLDQAMGLVEGKMSGPDGRFEGELLSGKLTGLWASKDSSVGKLCARQRLGASNWGTIKAELSANGTKLNGFWGTCDQSPVIGFKAIRAEKSAAPETGRPTPPKKSASLKTPTKTATPTPASDQLVTTRLTCVVKKGLYGPYCPKLNSNQVIKAGRDSQHDVTCKAGNKAAWLKNGTLRSCTPATATVIAIQDLKETSVTCAGQEIEFNRNGMYKCDNAILKNNRSEYKCDRVNIYRSKDRKTGQIVLIGIDCNAKSDKSSSIEVNTSIGPLQCKEIGLDNKLSVERCWGTSATSLVYHRDGEKYQCPDGAKFSFKPDGKLQFLDKNCRSDGAQLKARLVKLGMAEPLCSEWKSDGTCTEKDIIDELSLRPGDDTKIVCESGYEIRADGSVSDCKLAAPTPIPVPGADGDKANCSGEIYTSKAGFVTQCDQDEPSSVRVVLPNNLGNAVCKSKKLRFFDDGTLQACEFKMPVPIKTPRIALSCTGVYFDAIDDKPFLRYCGFSGAGEVRDSGGNTLICDQAKQMEVVALNAKGAIDIGKYKKERKGYCRLKP